MRFRDMSGFHAHLPLLTFLLGSLLSWQGANGLCFALAETVATFDQVFQPLGEAGGQAIGAKDLFDGPCHCQAGFHVIAPRAMALLHHTLYEQAMQHGLIDHRAG
jgi:hypothetical protein